MKRAALLFLALGLAAACAPVASYATCATNTDCRAGESCSLAIRGGICTHGCLADAECPGGICGMPGAEGICLPRCDVNQRPCARADLQCIAGRCGGLPQAPECIAYLACAEAIKPGSTSALLQLYGPQGSCWDGFTRVASECASECSGARTRAAQQTTNPPAECL